MRDPEPEKPSLLRLGINVKGFEYKFKLQEGQNDSQNCRLH
jgi:hypothetical protein